MSRIKFSSFLIHPVMLVILISIVLTSFQIRFLITSFKINSGWQQIPVINLLPIPETESLISSTTRIKLKNRILDEPGYTLGFFIKTANQSQKETLLFYSTDIYVSSGYWNISLIDGKIETARIEHIPPIITDKKINDNQWHHILVTANSNEARIYIDDKLSKNTLANYLKTPDKWFIVDINKKLVGDDQIHLKDFIFINKDLTPLEFEIYRDFFLGNSAPLYLLILFRFFTNLLVIISFYGFLVLIIKLHYENQTLFSIIDNVSNKLYLFLLAAISLWTGYGYQVSLLCLFFFFYFVLQNYKNIFPDYLRAFVNFPISYLIISVKLLRQFKIKEFLHFSTSQKPEVYFLLFLFLGLLLSFNRFLFTNNLFR